MTFIAVVAATPEGRIAKYAEFERKADAGAHVARFGGFVAVKPVGAWPDWKINMSGKALTIEKRPEPPPPPERPTVTAIKRIAAATGVDLSDLEL